MNKPRIQDDLYTYVNQEKLDQLVIPDDQPATGGFNTLAKEVEETMINEFKEMSANKSYPNDYLKNACTLFEIIKNVEKKEKDGITPALNNLKATKKVLLVVDELTDNVILATRNLQNVVLLEANEINSFSSCCKFFSKFFIFSSYESIFCNRVSNAVCKFNNPPIVATRCYCSNE